MTESRQVTPATISRGRMPIVSWSSLYGRYGSLATPQMRRISNWGVPGACKTTLLHMAVGLPWTIVNKDGKEDDQANYFKALIDNANDGFGGAEAFFSRWGDDIITARQGGMFEVARNKQKIARGVYNIDANTMVYDPSNKTQPYYQTTEGSRDIVRFRQDEVAHSLWHPMTEIDLPMLNRTPIQLAYLMISILSSADDFNIRSLNEIVPQGILNLGPGFDRQRAIEWKEAWDAAKQASGRLQDIGLLWGTDKIDFKAFQPPPRDMGFENSNHWYASVVAACFEMSIMDISILTRVSTRAAATEQGSLSRRQGLRHLLRLMKRGVEHYILPEGYKFIWDPVDPRDDKAEADVRRVNSLAVEFLVKALGPYFGVKEARRWGIVTEELLAEMEKDKANLAALIPQPGQFGNNAATDVTAEGGNASPFGTGDQGPTAAQRSPAPPDRKRVMNAEYLQPPTINVTMPDMITLAGMPKQEPPIVNVINEIPQAAAPTVNITNEIPQAAPAEVNLTLPEMSPVINVAPSTAQVQVDVEAVASEPVINNIVTPPPSTPVELPGTTVEKIEVTKRDDAGLLAEMVKTTTRT